MSTCCCTGPTTGDHLCPCQRRAEDARRTAQYWKGEHLAGNEQIAALQAKLDAVTKDSERLDFMIEWLGCNDDLEGSGIRDWIDYADARAAIDAALTDQGRAGDVE